MTQLPAPQKIYYKKFVNNEKVMEGQGWIVSQPTLYKHFVIFGDNALTISIPSLMDVISNKDNEPEGWTFKTADGMVYKIDYYTLEQVI